MLIEIIDGRVSRLRSIVAKVTSNKWLTPEENNYLKLDQALGRIILNSRKRINRVIKN